MFPIRFNLRLPQLLRSQPTDARRFVPLRGAAIAVSLLTTCSAAQACDQLVEVQAASEKAATAIAVADQLHVPNVSVRQVYRSDEWRLINVVTSDKDRPILIYSADPLTTRYVTMWGGMSDSHSDEQVLKWAHDNAPDMPEPLAQCLATLAQKAHATPIDSGSDLTIDISTP